MAISREQLVLDLCRRLRNVMKEIPPSAPHYLRFNNRIVAVETRVESDVEAADQNLQALLRDLAGAPDGMGGVILNAERHGKYLDRPGEV